MTQRIGLTFVLVASLALSGCSALHVGKHQVDPLVVVLFDVSKSTSDPEVRARYLTAFERVLDNVVVEHGTIVGDVVDDNPLAHSTYPISATFDACDTFTDNRLECDARATRLRQQVVAQARTILASVPTATGTDIHDGLSLAERVFDAYPEAGARSLVVLSDMVERSSRLNVGRARFDEDSIAPTLDAFALDGLIADLSGVSVYVVGAGVGAGSELSADRFLTIQHFWQAYLSRAGTDLPTERYGAALVRFPNHRRKAPVVTSPLAADPPFSLEPVVGWRVWALERIDGTLRLRSITRSDHWPANEVMEAKCDRHQGSTRPSDRCSCGLYAASSPENLARSGVFNNATCVIGAIAMWGTVIEHARGARSRFAYPARLRLVCGSCLAGGSGAIEPVSVIGSSGSLMVVCRRHRLGSRASTRPAAEVQAELLSAYGVELLPIERVSRGLRSGTSRVAHPAGWYIQMALTVVIRLLGFVINAVMAIWVFSGFLLVGAAVIGAIADPFVGGSDAVAALPTVVVESPAPLADTGIMLPPETDEPYRGGLVAPPNPFADMAFLCGMGAGTRVDLVPCTPGGSDLWGFAVLTEPEGARNDCVGGWDAYTRGLHYWICWNEFGEQAFVHRWANAPNPFMIPRDEGGALDEHR